MIRKFNVFFQLSLLSLLSFPLYAHNDFTFQNKPINPACIAMFNSSFSDYPYINSINLNQCQNSNAAYQTTHKSDNGSYYFYHNNKNDDKGRYVYRVIGKTNNGIYVVNTHDSGGGTMVAEMLLLIRLLNSKQYVYGMNDKTEQVTVKKITEMSLIGYVLGGDRCTGSFSGLKVLGNKIITKQYMGQNALDCSKSKEVLIDLGAV